MLSHLQAGEFIYEQPASPGAEYVFKHALTQVVAYNSLLIERRKLMHEQAGLAMESLYAERLGDHLDELAHHYGSSDNITKAVEYLGPHRPTSDSALDAFDEAIGNLNLALKLPMSPARLTAREVRRDEARGCSLKSTTGSTKVSTLRI
jgi:predicted ATPase